MTRRHGLDGFAAQQAAGGALAHLGPLEDAPRFADVAPTARSRKPARQGEGLLSDAIRAALALEPGLLLFRNSQAAMRKGSRVYRGGLGNGSADLVGVLNVRAFEKIEDRGFAPLHVGRFVALEVKATGEIPTAERIARIVAKLPGLTRAGWHAEGFTPAVERVAKDIISADELRDLSQWAWLASVRARGGFAAYVDSMSSARAAIARARRGELT